MGLGDIASDLEKVIQLVGVNLDTMTVVHECRTREGFPEQLIASLVVRKRAGSPHSFVRGDHKSEVLGGSNITRLNCFGTFRMK